MYILRYYSHNLVHYLSSRNQRTLTRTSTDTTWLVGLGITHVSNCRPMGNIQENKQQGLWITILHMDAKYYCILHIMSKWAGMLNIEGKAKESAPFIESESQLTSVSRAFHRGSAVGIWWSMREAPAKVHWVRPVHNSDLGHVLMEQNGNTNQKWTDWLSVV